MDQFLGWTKFYVTGLTVLTHQGVQVTTGVHIAQGGRKIFLMGVLKWTSPFPWPLAIWLHIALIMEGKEYLKKWGCCSIVLMY